MTCRRIVFTGDFLRPHPKHLFPTQSYNIQWCADLLSRQVSLATGLETEMVACNYEGVSTGQLAFADLAGIYESYGQGLGIGGWAKLYGERETPAAVAEIFERWFSDALVVGFELPTYVRGFLDAREIPYVDVIVHPVRFLDDVFFGFRSSHAEANMALAGFALPEEQIETMAGIQRAGARRDIDMGLKPNSGLLVLQTSYDRSLLGDNGFASTADYLEDISQFAGRFETLYIKTHPYEPASQQAETVLRGIPNSRRTTLNAYKLLAADQIAEVGTLSSSVGIEAGYFKKPTRFFFRPPCLLAADGAIPETDEYVGVLDAFLSADFWRRVLSAVCETTARSGVRIASKPNRLRTSLHSFWSFNEIDTDVALEAAERARESGAAAEHGLPDGEVQGLSSNELTFSLPCDLLPHLVLADKCRRRDDGAIEIGSGKPGHAVFGPYTTVPSGSYGIRLRMSRAGGNSLRETGDVVADVAINGGQDVLAVKRFPSQYFATGQFEEPVNFVIPASLQVASLELRIWTDGETPVLLEQAVLNKRVAL